MPKKRPEKTSFKVSLPEPLVRRMDDAVYEDGYGGRSDLIDRLLRNYLDERDRLKSLNTEYQILQERSMYSKTGKAEGKS